MEFNDHFVEWLVKQRLTERRADAQRYHLLSKLKRPRRPLRVALGTALIRAGAWLLREVYSVMPR
ncbi:MAG: hypothetical protein HY614_09835 [Candidatus Rokubacteria bacterium]|nr:hypothetical protein [Candidatus Rokubacteria bacterium]